MPPLKSTSGKDLETEGWLADFLASGSLLSAGEGRVWLGWGKASRRATPSPEALSLFTPDFFLESPTPWIHFEFFAEASIQEAISALSKTVLQTQESPYPWESPSHDEFARDFNQLKSLILAGTLTKAVPVVFSRTGGTLQKAALQRTILRLLHRSIEYPVTVYGCWGEGIGKDEGLLGATPEILFESTSSGVKTMALAGTRRRNSQQCPLLEDPKELEEHRIVIGGIERSLAGFGKITVGPTGELQLPTLTHLHTPIELKPHANVSFETLVQALHPTPALGAWPRERGMQWLRGLESASARSRFGAPFGMTLPDGQSRCVVAIRNIQWSATEMRVGAGCGVVKASVLEREWLELQAKMDAVKESLQV